MKKTSKQISQKKNLEVNDIIFRELLKRGYSVEKTNKVWTIAASKMWYLTPEQSQAFIDLENKDPKQKMFLKKESELIKKSFAKLIGEIGDKAFNLIDVGSRDGEKAFAFIKNFKDKSKIRYCPIDINNFMIDKAVKTLSKVSGLNIARVKFDVSDFVDLNKVTLPLRKGRFSTNLLLLLGGNLENSDVHELLHNVRSSMRDGDYLLVGNKLTHPDPNKMVKYYSRSKYIENLAFQTAKQLGLDKGDIEYDSRFRGNRVEMFYTLKNDKIINSGGKILELKTGDKVIIVTSAKYTKDSLLEALNLYFDDVELYTSLDNIYALALCKKT